MDTSPMNGRQLLHYRIEEKIGEGGMGVVYKGIDLRLNRPVALKFLPQILPTEAAERKRFLREARTASAINHPNICVIHAIEEVEEQVFMVMEYVEGKTLRRWMRENTPGTSTMSAIAHQAASITTQIADGLAAAHGKGIVHRDIKPENIMVGPTGHVKIMDFGLAILAGESRITRTGATIGTIAYMSPEQVRGEKLDLRSDMYSFGILLYEILSGRLPYQADHPIGMMYAIVNSSPELLSRAKKDIPPALEKVVMKCIAKEKSARFASMNDVRKALDEIFVGHPTVTVPVPVRRTQRKTLPYMAAGLLAVGAIIGGILIFSPRDDRSLQQNPLASRPGLSAQPHDTSTVSRVKEMPKETPGENDVKTPTEKKAESSDHSLPALSTTPEALAGAITGHIASRTADRSISVSIAPFTYQQTQVGSSFSLYLKALLESRASSIRTWRLVSDEQRPAQQPGKGLRENILALKGTIWPRQNNLQVIVKLQDQSTGAVIATTEELIPQETIRRLGYDWTAPNFKNVLTDTRRLGTPEASTGPLSLNLRTNKGTEDLVFRDGDTLKVIVTVNTPCRVRVFYHTVDGNRILLTGKDDLVITEEQVNTPVLISTEICTSPYGAEILQAFATAGSFAPLKTKMVGDYVVVDDRIEDALVATRGIRKAHDTETPVEKRVVVTTVSR
jgi:serine/threonine protein kinase